MGTSTTEFDFFDRCSTHSTGLVRAIVNPRYAAVIAVGALDIEVIAKCSAALLDRGSEDVYGGLMQFGYLAGEECISKCFGVNLAHK